MKWLRQFVGNLCKVLFGTRAEAIEMQERRYNYFPRRFRWHGEDLSVEAVERYWATGGDDAHKRQYFQVRCADGHTYNIFQQITVNTWHIETRVIV